MLKHNPSSTSWNYIQQILNENKNPTIFELGVHWAEDTRRIMNNCNGIPDYHGFEPDPRNIKIIKSQNLPLGFKLNEGAVGRKDEVLELHLSEGNHPNPNNNNPMTGANSIRPPKEVTKRHNWIKFNKKIKVKCFSIDTYCKKNNIDHIDFIWCDIQGAEYDMILGAKDILSRTKYATLEYSDIELYEGQKKIEDYMKLLRETGDWEIVHKFNIDILIQNKSLLK